MTNFFPSKNAVNISQEMPSGAQSKSLQRANTRDLDFGPTPKNMAKPLPNKNLLITEQSKGNRKRLDKSVEFSKNIPENVNTIMNLNKSFCGKGSMILNSNSVMNPCIFIIIFIHFHRCCIVIRT